MNKKKRAKRQVLKGCAYIKSTFNNTIVTITDEKGEVISSVSTGQVGFKGSKKGTPFAAQMAGDLAAKKAIESVGMETISVVVKGPGSGRETAIRAIQAAGMDVDKIEDRTPIPHNGCRPSKRRRV